MNQKISNAPVIGMIVAIMLLTISAGVNIWLYNENNALDDIQQSQSQLELGTHTFIERLETITNMDWGCFLNAVVNWTADIERGYILAEDNEEVWRQIVCTEEFQDDLNELYTQMYELEQK